MNAPTTASPVPHAHIAAASTAQRVALRHGQLLPGLRRERHIYLLSEGQRRRDQPLDAPH